MSKKDKKKDFTLSPPADPAEDEQQDEKTEQSQAEIEKNLAEQVLNNYKEARRSAEEKGSGRKSKDEQKAEKIAVNADLVSLPYNFINAYISSSSSGEVSLSKKEIKDLSILTANVLNKHLDVDMIKLQEEVALAIYMSSLTAEKTTEYKKKHPEWRFPIPFRSQFKKSWKWIKSFWHDESDK